MRFRDLRRILVKNRNFDVIMTSNDVINNVVKTYSSHNIVELDIFKKHVKFYQPNWSGKSVFNRKKFILLKFSSNF